MAISNLPVPVLLTLSPKPARPGAAASKAKGYLNSSLIQLTHIFPSEVFFLKLTLATDEGFTALNKMQNQLIEFFKFLCISQTSLWLIFRLLWVSLKLSNPRFYQYGVRLPVLDTRKSLWSNSGIASSSPVIWENQTRIPKILKME